MKKTIVLVLVLVSLLAFAGTAGATPWGSIWPSAMNGSINPLGFGVRPTDPNGGTVMR